MIRLAGGRRRFARTIWLRWKGLRGPRAAWLLRLALLLRALLIGLAILRGGCRLRRYGNRRSIGRRGVGIVGVIEPIEHDEHDEDRGQKGERNLPGPCPRIDLRPFRFAIFVSP
jgi:hypothetical protein